MASRKILFESNEHSITCKLGEGSEEITLNLDLSTIPTDIVAKAAIFGLKRKIGNSIIGLTSTSDMENAITTCIQNLQNSQWTEKVARKPAVTKEKIALALAGLTEAERIALLPLLAKVGL